MPGFAPLTLIPGLRFLLTFFPLMLLHFSMRHCYHNFLDPLLTLTFPPLRFFIYGSSLVSQCMAAGQSSFYLPYHTPWSCMHDPLPSTLGQNLNIVKHTNHPTTISARGHFILPNQSSIHTRANMHACDLCFTNS